MPPPTVHPWVTSVAQRLHAEVDALVLDGKEILASLWRRVKPSADETPHALFGED